MQFPRFVFISPGPIECQGGTYNQELTVSAEDYAAALKAGYSASIPEALASVKAIVTKDTKLEKGEAPKVKLINRTTKAV